MKKKLKVSLCLFIITTLLFSIFTPIVYADTVEDDSSPGGGFILKKLGKLLVETFCKLITPTGDAFVDMISAAIGEVATIDGAVYNRISKVDIDFFAKDEAQYYNKNGTLMDGVTPPLRVSMKDVVNTMYGMLRGLAIIVLLVMLVYIGIKIMITSTAEKKASYKTVFFAWVMGVSMLMLFPYVMKYTIQLNSALCTWIGGENNFNSVKTNDDNQYQITPLIYGTDNFVNKMLKPGEEISQNAMMYVRYYGANTYNVPLLVIYFIMIGQLLAILIMYYKRVFMLAFLITIFPLVAMIYPLNKIGDVKMNPFGTWFKEFAVNVFVQSFHAATYRVIVSLGVSSYLENGNWLFMIMCILFLFEGEKIVRAIFNAKSSMNSIGDMAMAGAMAMSIMQKAGSLLPDFGKSKKEEDSDDEMDAMKKAKADRITATSRKTPGTESNLTAARRMSTGNGDTSGISGELDDSGAQFESAPLKTETGSGVSANSSEVKIGRNVGADTSTPFSTTESQIEGIKSEREIGKYGNKFAKVAGTAFSATSQLTGATVGMTYGLAQSDAQTAAAGLATGASAGAKIGKAGKTILEGAVDKYADIQAAKALAGEYINEEHDEEIGIKNSDMSEQKKQAIREAYAKLARRTGGIRSKEGAQLRFIKERIEIEEKNK